MTNTIIDMINQYGVPTVVAVGMAYFIFYVWKAYEQAEENSGDYEPIVVITRNNTKPLVLIDADYFVKLHLSPPKL